tara:strand:+ start:1189 stop:1368 length:180 start_codon:yes stop_codon:yes gene_type:complete
MKLKKHVSRRLLVIANQVITGNGGMIKIGIRFCSRRKNGILKMPRCIKPGIGKKNIILY